MRPSRSATPAVLLAALLGASSTTRVDTCSPTTRRTAAASIPSSRSRRRWPPASFDGWSDLHYRPDDELRYEVGRHTVTGNTDRFTFRFRKPG